MASMYVIGYYARWKHASDDSATKVMIYVQQQTWTLSERPVKGTSACVCAVDETKKSLEVNKIDGFSKLHNIQFEQKGIRVWRSYGIGRGKEIPFDQLVSQGQESTGLVITSNFFALKDTRVYKCKEPLAESSDDDHDSIFGCELDIFECSEHADAWRVSKHFRSSNRIWTSICLGDQIEPRPGSSRFSESLTLVSRQGTRQTLRRFLTICARQQEMNKTIGCYPDLSGKKKKEKK